MFDAWNAVDFSPSETLNGIGNALMPAVEGLASDVQAGAEKLLSSEVHYGSAKCYLLSLILLQS